MGAERAADGNGRRGLALTARLAPPQPRLQQVHVRVEGTEIAAHQEHEGRVGLTGSESLRGARGRDLPGDLHGLVDAQGPMAEETPLSSDRDVPEAGGRRRHGLRLAQDARASQTDLHVRQQADLQEEWAPRQRGMVAEAASLAAHFQFHDPHLRGLGGGRERRAVRVDLDGRVGRGRRRQTSGAESHGEDRRAAQPSWKEHTASVQGP